MAWVVDTCLVVDIAGADPLFAAQSAKCLQATASDGLILCPVSYVELAPLWGGNGAAQDQALELMGIAFLEPWTHVDTCAAREAWHRQVIAKRSGHTGKRPIADILIGAYAMRFQGLLTRNPSDFQHGFPLLVIDTP